MNILIFTTTFHPSIGGLEKHTLMLMYEFLRRGYVVKVIATQFQLSNAVSATARLQGVDVYYQPNFFKMLRLYLWCNTMFMPNLSLKGIWLLPFNRSKKLVISHNDNYLSNQKSLKIKLKLGLLKYAAHNIAVSKSVADSMKVKSTIIFNCYDDEVFKIYDDEKSIYDFVFLGRLVSQKGCDFLIKALKNIRQPFTLNIIGNGPEKQVLEQMVADFGLQDNVRFLGVLEGEQLARTLNRHKTMVIPSLGEEGFGIVALEGMACGCKIIAADAGGLSEAVNKYGKIFEMGNQKQLEALLNEQMAASDNISSPRISSDLNNYLNSHKKEAIASKYLRLFE